MSQRTVAHIRPHSPGGICKLYTPGGLGLKEARSDDSNSVADRPLMKPVDSSGSGSF
jgi:hypothetical protein